MRIPKIGMNKGKSSKIEGVIFDLGHTLINFQSDWEEIEEKGIQSLLDFLKKEGFPASSALVQAFSLKRYEGHLEADLSLVEYTAEKALQEAFRKFNLNGKSEKLILDALEAYFQPELENWQSRPDSVVVLQTLKKAGYRVGLISNATHHSFVLNCVRRFGFGDYLDPVISSASFHVRKPHPEIFLHVAGIWGMDPGKIAVVGDQLYFDIYGAHQVGMKGILLKELSNKAHTFIPEPLGNDPRLIPDETLNSLSELIKKLQ